MHLLSLQSDCHPCDPDARWLSTFLVSQVHRSLPPIVSGRRLGGDVDVNFPDDRSLLFLSLAAPTVPLPGWAKLLHLNPTNYQQVPSAAQREREWNYESENASAALFSPAMLFYSPLLLVLLRGVACRCQASCGKTVKREISKEELEKSCLILRIHVSSQFSELRPSSHPPPCKCCSSQWVAQAGLVYNPLIITKCIEDFDERGKSRHWIPIMWCMLGAGTRKHHQYVQCILSLHPFSCR